MVPTVRRNCDCDCCRAFHDEYDRADAANLGDRWNHRAGTITIASNKAASSTADSLARITTAVGASGSALATLTGAAGDQAIVVVGWKDDNTFHYAQWEFQATDAELSLWRVESGTHTQIRGPYVVCERGAGVTTRLRVCLSAGLNAYVIDPETDEELLKIRAASFDVGDLGNYAGIGTKDIAGGVTFDDFAFYLSSVTHGTCPACELCPFCPDTQELCINLEGGFGFDGWVQMLRSVDHDDDDDDGDPDTTPAIGGSRNCRWLVDPSYPAPPDGYVEAWIQKATDDHYYLWVRVSQGGECNIWFRKDLGTCPPNCAEWDCLEVPFHSVTGNLPFGAGPCPYGGQTVTVSSGDVCCYHYAGDDPCCQGVELPGSVFVTITEDGEPFMTDQQFDGGTFLDGILYEDEFGNFFRCDPPGDPGLTVEGIEGFIPMTIDSCEPFSASGGKTQGGHTYVATITE